MTFSTDGYTAMRDLGWGGSGYYITSGMYYDSTPRATLASFPAGAFGLNLGYFGPWPQSSYSNPSYLTSSSLSSSGDAPARDIAVSGDTRLKIYQYDLSAAFHTNISIWGSRVQFPLIKFWDDGNVTFPVYCAGSGKQFDTNMGYTRTGWKWDGKGANSFDVGIRHAGVYTKNATVTVANSGAVNLSYEFNLDVQAGDELVVANINTTSVSTMTYTWIFWPNELAGWEKK